MVHGQERMKASGDLQKLMRPGRLILLRDPSSDLPTLGLVCGVLVPPGKEGFGSATGEMRLSPEIGLSCCQDLR